jgi:thymidylate synthase
MLQTAHDVYSTMLSLTTEQKVVHHFTASIDLKNTLVINEHFSLDALEAYTRYNLGQDLLPQDESYFDAQRGGSQGDYREGMLQKIANIVNCLTQFPQSKRAVITIPNKPLALHSETNEAKCLREIHFYLDGDVLNGAAYFRAQAAIIFPKNIHFMGGLFYTVASNLGSQINLGALHYVTTTLVRDRQ